MYDEIFETSVSDGDYAPDPEIPVEDYPVENPGGEPVVVVSGGDSEPVVIVSGGDSPSGAVPEVQEADYSTFYEKLDSIDSELNIVIVLLLLSFCVPRIIHGIRRMFDNE